MIRGLRSELKKMLSIRSTYVVLLIAVALTTLVNFYFEGYRGVSESAAALLAPTALQEIIINSSGIAAVFIVIVGILHVAHEYRYNTITYTLTLDARRTRVFINKTLSIVLFGLTFGAIIVAVSLAGYYLGLSLRDATLPVQEISWLTLLGKVALYFSIYSLIGLVLAFIIKNLVGAIAFYFIVPSTVESILSIWLKEKTSYLPFTMFDAVLGNGIIDSSLSIARILVLATLYIAAGWVVAWLLFLKRDAN